MSLLPALSKYFFIHRKETCLRETNDRKQRQQRFIGLRLRFYSSPIHCKETDVRSQSGSADASTLGADRHSLRHVGLKVHFSGIPTH